MIDLFLPQKAATIEQLGHPSAGIIGWTDTSSNTSNEVVNQDIALTYSAVWCAVRVISETLAGLPCILYRKNADGSKERATEDPRFQLVHQSPNPEQTAFEWFDTCTQHVLLWGNGYTEIFSDQMGQATSLELRLPDRVMLKRGENGRLTYEISEPADMVDFEDMLHVKGLSFDGLTGKSVVSYAAQSLGTAIAAEKHAGSVLANGGRPSGILSMPAGSKPLSKEAREKFRREWDEQHGGSENAAKIAILHGGITYQQTAMSNEDAQFLESRKFSVTEIARWFRLPPHMLADLEKATFSNITEQSIEFVVYSMMPWIRRWETNLNRKLLMSNEREGMFFEFLVDGLLRGKLSERYAAYATARNWGWLSINDIRKLENMNPIEDGDDYLHPLNMTTVGEDPPMPQESAPSEQVPDSLEEEQESNLRNSLARILRTARGVKQAVAVTGDYQAAALAGQQQLNEDLAGLRADREEIKAEIASLGDRPVQVSCSNCHDGWKNLQTAALAMAQGILRQQRQADGRLAEKAAKAQSGRGESYIDRIDTHYANLRGPLEGKLEAVAGMLDVPKLVDVYLTESKARLLDCADGSPEDFAGRVSACVKGWTEQLPEMGGYIR